MTTLPNRPRTALIVIDVQNGVVNGTPNRDGVVANINTLVGQARAQDVPVIWVQHNDDGLRRGSADWEWVAELARAPPSRWCTRTTAIRSRRPTSSRCWPSARWAG